MAVSYRQQLAKIGEPKPGAGPPALPGGFQIAPRSFRSALRAMESPQPEQWFNTGEGKFPNLDWTQDCQGVATDSVSWFISSNNDQRLYRLSPAHEVTGHLDLSGAGSLHLGDIDYYDGVIYCAMENPPKIIMVGATEFAGYRIVEITGKDGGPRPQEDWLPWCAINPWNGFLYSSKFGGDGNPTRDIFAYKYRPSAERFEHLSEADIRLECAVGSIQGGCFSKNGHLLLASNDTDNISCFSVLNGAFLGAAPIEKDSVTFEEVEGITIWENVFYDGVPTHVHVILLDNDAPDGDDVYFKHYHVPAWGKL